MHINNIFIIKIHLSISFLDDFHLVIERAKKANVKKMIITGTNLSESKEAVELISKPEYSK